MVVFEDKFLESKGKPIEYNGKVLQMMDVIKMTESEENHKVSFIQVNSEWKQGITLSTKGKFFINEKDFGSNIALWQDTAPKEIILKIQSTSKQFDIKNIWDVGDGTMHSWHAGAAMNIKSLNKGKKEYYCNDGHLDDNLNDLVFSLEKID